jgi:hypothetical protein
MPLYKASCKIPNTYEEKVLPKLVVTHEDAYKSIAYDKLTVVLVEALNTT